MLISLRYKVLALVATSVLGAMLSYVWLATTLFTDDKLAYIYDLNSQAALTLGEELRAALDTTVDKIQTYSSDRQRLFRSEPALLQLVTYERDEASGNMRRTQSAVNEQALARANVTAADLAEAEQHNPVDFAATLQLERVLDNVSLPPDVALWRLSLRISQTSAVAATLAPDRFLRLFGGTAAYSASLIDARGNVLAHPDPKKIIAHQSLRDLAIVREALESKAPRAVQTFAGTNGERVVGAYAQVASFGVAVITETPEVEAKRTSAELVRRSILFGVGIVLLAFLVSLFFARRISSPLLRLSAAMSQVGRGDFNVNVPIESKDEVGVLAAAFNTMAKELDDRDRRIEQTREELHRAERLAALGVLGAEITHEVKNPLTAIVGLAQLGKTSSRVDELKDYLQSIEAQTKRARELLENFLTLTRHEQARYEQIDVNAVVADTLKLVRHQLANNKVEVRTLLSVGNATVLGNANQLQQVLLNLVLNADQAMASGGVLTVATERIDGHVVLRVRDTGSGMSDEVKKQLFKPFFTTKPKGQGTGLGLSVSHNIIQQHAAEVMVESAPGVGTTFIITFPRIETLEQALASTG